MTEATAQKAREIINRAVGHGFEWKEGQHEGEPGIFLKAPQAPDGEVVHVAYSEMDDLSWDTIYRFVMDGRNVVHMTRVVGYFSKVQNWNPSKIGERKDRGQGNYEVA